MDAGPRQGSQPPLPTGKPQESFHNPFDVTWHERIVVLGSVFGGIAAAIVLGLLYNPSHTHELLWAIPSSFFALGKFLPVLSVRPDSHFNAYELGVVIGIMDTVTVLVIVYSLEPLYRFRPVAHFLEKSNQNARLVMTAYPWMRKFAITAIVLFVLFPVAGTGAIGGSFLGAILGLHRVRLILAVSIGGFLGGLMMAYLTVLLEETVTELKSHPSVIAGMALLIAGLICGMTLAYKKALAKAARDASQAHRETRAGFGRRRRWIRTRP